MQLQTILNRVEKYKSFVCAGSKWREKNVSLEIKIEARRNGKPICSGCGELAPGCDRQPPRARQLQFICSDMWRPYLQVIAARASQAVHILHRFHIMTKLNKAIEEVRATETRQLQADGEALLLIVLFVG